MTSIEINYQLLTKLARVTFSREDVEVTKTLLNDANFDKGLFVATVFKQKVAGIAYLNIIRWGIGGLLPWLGFPLKFFYLANRERNKRIQKELKRVLRSAARHGVDVRPLKGSVLVPLIYNDGGSRLLTDIDLFVRRTDISKATNVLNDLGYAQGKFNKHDKRIDLLAREEKLLWQLKMFETPPFLKVMNDEYVDSQNGNYFTLDLSFGFGFAEHQDISELIMDAEAKIGGFRTLSVIDFFIQLCGHLYKEASNEAWINIDLGINLIKFCDVREFALKMLTLRTCARLRDRVLELGAEKSVHFSLHFVFIIYEDAFIAEMIEALSFKFEDDTFMAAVYRQGGTAVAIRAPSLIQSIGAL